MKTRILVVDDDQDICAAVRENFAKADSLVEAAYDGKDGLAKFIAMHPDVVFLDVRLGQQDGLEVLDAILKHRHDVPVIVMSGQSSVATAVDAIKRGAFHYLTKPFLLTELDALVEKAIESTSLKREVQVLRREQERTIRRALDEMVGESRAMKEVRSILAKVAAGPATTVLIEGETGTGKEVAARTLHYLSDRKDRPFIPVSCSAPASLLEAELFGHGRVGPGGSELKPGLFEAASEGTLFLDNIGDMPLPVQGKLVRVLEEPGQPAGMTFRSPHPVRVVAATGKNLADAVAAGTFREDLYFRLQVVYIYLPPLREHTEDIELLARRFIGELSVDFNRPPIELTPQNVERLLKYPWPGNVRELRNCVARAILLGQSAVEPGLEQSERRRKTTRLFRRDGEPRTDGEWHIHSTSPSIEDMERELIRTVLEHCQGNKLVASQMLGINRTTLYRKLTEYKLLTISVRHRTPRSQPIGASQPPAGPAPVPAGQ